jgi:hypothetical protein
MICINCQSGDYKVIYTERYPCSHCEGELVIEYCMCEQCGLLWRGADGVVIEGSATHTEDVLNILDPMSQLGNSSPEDLSEEDREFLDKIEKELKRTGEVETMADMVHRCLHCNSLAHEVRPGYYECENCDFSWGVVRFE